MTLTCDIYKGQNKIGSGRIKPGSLVVDDYVPFMSRYLGTGRHVVVKLTDGAAEPREWRARVEVVGASFISLTEPCPT
jgi:hypothetical protein